MSDMRLVVAGAGGRMGRTLIQAIAATKGVTLAGAVEAAGSAVIGRDAGELAGLGSNGVKVVSDVAPLLRDADGLIELCGALLSGRGEASGTAMAREVLDIYQELDAAGRRAFFEGLVRDFGPDRERLAQAIEKWRANLTPRHMRSDRMQR